MRSVEAVIKILGERQLAFREGQKSPWHPRIALTIRPILLNVLKSLAEKEEAQCHGQNI